jgi:hypothetical protein
MELQLLEEADFDDLYAEMLPNSAYKSEIHPMVAAYKAYLAWKNGLNELGEAAILQSTMIEDEHDELYCLLSSCVYLTFIIDGEERYLY